MLNLHSKADSEFQQWEDEGTEQSKHHRDAGMVKRQWKICLEKEVGCLFLPEGVNGRGSIDLNTQPLPHIWCIKYAVLVYEWRKTNCG